MKNNKIIFAIGDIHGRLDLLEGLLEKIKNYPNLSNYNEKEIIFLGDYVDRGPDSKGVIDLIMSEPLKGFKQIALKGNHEVLLQNVYESNDLSPKYGGTQPIDIWYSNGGVATLESFGGDIEKKYTDWISKRPLWYKPEGFDYMFVHAGINPFYKSIHDQLEKDLIWIRYAFIHDTSDYGYKVVFGHTIFLTPLIMENKIGIDTGAYATGILTALVLHDNVEQILQYHDEKNKIVFKS